MEIKFTLVLSFFLLATGLNAQSLTNSSLNKLALHGKIAKSEGKWVYITKHPYFNNDVSADSIKSDMSGSFVYYGALNEPTLHMLQIGDQSVELLLEPGTIRITGNADSLERMQLAGSEEEAIRRIYLDSMARVDSRIIRNQILSAKYSGDSVKLKVLERKLFVLSAKERRVRLDLMKIYPLASTSVYQAGYFLTSHESRDLVIADSLLSLYEGSKIAHYEQVKFLRSSWDKARKLVLGEPAHDFVQYDTTGREVLLTSLKGRYLLVDFWASWCGPCRQENPMLVAIKKEFSGRNFDIISVSLDSDSKAWLKAIKADQMNWMHASDLKGWENSAARVYGIQGVPFNFLLDPAGKVLAVNVRGADLRPFLQRNLP